MSEKLEDEKIKYEPHPVSPERKRELRNQGYKIIDARFDPNPKTKKEGNVDRADQIAALKEKGVEVKGNISTKDLAELVAKHLTSEE